MARLFLVEVGSFMKKNILDLILVSLFMLVGLIIYVMNFNENNNSSNEENNKIKEGMITKDEIESANQCEKLMDDSSKIEAHCEKLSDTRCKYEECCVLLSEKSDDSNDSESHKRVTKCVAGSKSGPTYKSDENGNQIHYDEYYYLNEKYTIKN